MINSPFVIVSPFARNSHKDQDRNQDLKQWWQAQMQRYKAEERRSVVYLGWEPKAHVASRKHWPFPISIGRVLLTSSVRKIG